MSSEFYPPRKKERPDTTEGHFSKFKKFADPYSLKALMRAWLIRSWTVMKCSVAAFVPGLHLMRKRKYWAGVLLLIIYVAGLVVTIKLSLAGDASDWYFYPLFFFHIATMYFGLRYFLSRTAPGARVTVTVTLITAVITVASFYVNVQAYIRTHHYSHYITIRNKEYLPTFQPGDRLAIKPYDPPRLPIDRGDIAYFEVNPQVEQWFRLRYRGSRYETLERVIGLAGDTVVFDGNEISVNGHVLSGDYLPLVAYDLGNTDETREVPVASTLFLCSYIVRYRGVANVANTDDVYSYITVVKNVKIQGRVIRITDPEDRRREFP